MKKIVVLLVGILMTIMLCACNNSQGNNDSIKIEKENNKEENISDKGNYEMDKIEIAVGNETFTATLENNDTARNFKSLLPLTINMKDVNGNEKAYNFSQDIRKDKSIRPPSIHTGDIMCWSDNVLVIFYDDFTTPYSYVKIGSIENISGFVKALGRDSIKVTFK